VGQSIAVDFEASRETIKLQDEKKLSGEISYDETLL
jgi:hypothetical protein